MEAMREYLRTLSQHLIELQEWLENLSTVDIPDFENESQEDSKKWRELRRVFSNIQGFPLPKIPSYDPPDILAFYNNNVGEYKKKDIELLSTESFLAEITSEDSGGYYSWKRLCQDGETDHPSELTGVDNAKEVNEIEGIEAGEVVVMWPDHKSDPGEYRFFFSGLNSEKWEAENYVHELKNLRFDHLGRVLAVYGSNDGYLTNHWFDSDGNIVP